VSEHARTRELLEHQVLDAALRLRRIERERDGLLSGPAVPAAGAPGYSAYRNALSAARERAERELRSAVDDLLSEEPEPSLPPVRWLTVEDVVADALRVLRLGGRVIDVYSRDSTADERVAAIRARNLGEERLRRDVAEYVRAAAAAPATGAKD